MTRKRKKGCKLFTALVLMCVCAQAVFADDVNLQKVKIENSYLTAVAVDKKSAKVQEINISNSFLVFVKVKACNCNEEQSK